MYPKTAKFTLPGFILIVLGVFSFFSGCASTGEGESGTETVVYQEDFEAYDGSWKSRGDASLDITSDKAHRGTNSLHISGRGKTWHGAIYSLSGLKPKETYRISAWFMFNDESAPAQTVTISLQQNSDAGETYANLGSGKLPKDEWTYIEVEYTVPPIRSRTEIVSSLYFESAWKSDENTQSSDLFEFYVDDIAIIQLPPMPPPEVETDIPALYTLFADDFPLGTAIESGSHLDPKNPHYQLIRHFNVVVSGNDMKPSSIQPSEGRFTWTKADALMAYAENNNKKIRGHTLIWHEQVPDWFFTGSGPEGLASKEQLYARMETHIKETAGRYRGKIHTWDVVNETIDSSGEMRNSKYYQIAGSHEYIANAFRWAHQADPDALLCLNDFGIEGPGPKQDGFYNLLQTLLDEGVPVHIAGLQAHINMEWPTVADLRQTIRRLASLGVKVQITELDMSIYANDSETTKKADREMMIQQAHKYRALFEMFREEAQAGNLDMVVVWGLADDDSWLNNHPVPGRTDHPLFFGKDLRAKPAYWAMVDPSRMPIQLKRIDATLADHPISGIEDPAWNMVSPRAITDKQNNRYGWFKIMWDNTSLYTLIHTDSTDSADMVRFFIEPKNQKLETRSAAAFTREFTAANAIAAAGEDSGLTMLCVIPFEGKQEAQIGFDLRLEKDRDIHSWNDYDNAQETSSANYGTVNLRTLPRITYAHRGTIDLSGRASRSLDPAWNAAEPVPLTVTTSGYTEEGSRFRAMWDDAFLYVLTEVVDPALDDKAATVHEQDTVEVFLDQNNGKTASYEQDDGQYRVSFRNFVSFNGGDSARFKSRTMMIPGGYRIEMALPLYSIQPAPGHIVGFDVQINDAANGARAGIRNWASNTNMGYQTTADYGILILQ